MKIVALSDTHTQHGQRDIPDLLPQMIPEADVLVYAGDHTGCGEPWESNRFNLWLNQIVQVKIKLVIGGNHDRNLEATPGNPWITGPGVYLLAHQEIEVEGVRFFGSPWTPRFQDWSFMYDRFSLRAESLWKAVPDSTDVLITHGPPQGVLDLCPDGSLAGCEVLLHEIQSRIKPRIHIFGHIHSNGHIKHGHTDFYNVAVLNHDYEYVAGPTEIEI